MRGCPAASVMKRGCGVKSEVRTRESEVGSRTTGVRAQSLALALVLALGGASLVCLKAPRVPSWDTAVNLPLSDNTFRLLDLLDRRYFSVGSDSAMQFCAAVNFDTVRPISRIQLSPNPLSKSLGLADFMLTGKYAGRIVLALQDLLNETLPEQPTLMPIPAFTFSIDRSVSIGGIRSAEVRSGAVRVSVHNFSNVALDSLCLGCAMASLRFVGVEAQSGESLRAGLDGDSIGAENEVLIAGGSRGSNGRPIPVARDDSLVIDLQLDSLRLVSGELQVPAANVERTLFLGATANNSFALDSVTFAQGSAQLEFQNGLPVPVRVTCTIAELDWHGNLALPPFGVETVGIDLTGRTLGNSGSRNSLLTVDVRAATAASGDYVSIDQQQSLSVKATVQGMKPSHLAGTLRAPLCTTTPRKTLPGPLPNGFAALRLPRCRMDVVVTSGTHFRTRLKLHVVAVNKSGDSAWIDREVQMEPGRPDDPRTAEFHVPLAGLLNIGPEHLGVSCDIKVWGRGDVGENSSICGNASVSTPLRLMLVRDTIDMGSRIVTIDRSTRDRIDRYLVGGEVRAEIENHFPLGMNALVALTQVPDSADSAGSERACAPVELPVEIPAGVVDQREICRRSVDTTVTGELDSSQLDVFRNPRFAAHLLLYVPSTDTVEIRDQDFVRIRTRATLKLRVGGEK